MNSTSAIARAFAKATSGEAVNRRLRNPRRPPDGWPTPRADWPAGARQAGLEVERTPCSGGRKVESYMDDFFVGDCTDFEQPAWEWPSWYQLDALGRLADELPVEWSKRNRGRVARGSR